jgi:hypothetical protein
LIRIAPREFGVPDVSHRRFILAESNGQLVHYATTLRIGFLEPTPVTDRIIRPSKFVLGEVRGPASAIVDAEALTHTLGTWRSLATTEAALDLQPTVNVNHLSGNNRLINPWCVEPCWVIDVFDRNQTNFAGAPTGRIYDPSTRFFAKSPGDAAWKWLHDPWLRGAMTIPNQYKILIRDPRAWLSDLRARDVPEDGHASLMIELRTSLPQLPDADLVVETTEPDSTRIEPVDRTRFEISVPLEAKTLSVHVLSRTRSEWLDEYQENEFMIGKTRLLRTPGAPNEVRAGVGARAPAVENTPKAFISYAWEADAHRRWVEGFAATLRQYGIEAIIDQWYTAYGDQLPHFMEASIRDADYVLIICTPTYKERSDGRSGGVGYEGDIIAGEVLAGANPRKFIPILRRGTQHDAIPTSLIGKKYVDLTGDDIDARVMELVDRILGRQEGPPPLGPRPSA